ncbi:MAG: hypothetical protein WA919_07385 [Coleofasciculaceae cyanobacterium]
MIIPKSLLKLTAIFALSSLSFACTALRKNNNEQVLAQSSEPKIVYGNLIINEKSDYVMIPVLAEEETERGFSYPSSGTKSDSYHNFIFYNKSAQQSYLLLDKYSLITLFETIGVVEGGKQSDFKAFLFGIVENDTNGDGKLNRDDAIVAYLSDISGKKLQQITPPNTQLVSWQFDKASSKLFVKIRQDSNKDKKFTGEDETTFFVVDIKQTSMGTDIIGSELQEKLKSIRFKEAK